MYYCNNQLNNAINLDGLKFEDETYNKDEWTNYSYNDENQRILHHSTKESTTESIYKCESTSSYDSQGEFNMSGNILPVASSCSNCVNNRKCALHYNSDPSLPVKYFSQQDSEYFTQSGYGYQQNCGMNYDVLEESSQYVYNTQAVSSCQYNVDTNTHWDVGKIENDSKLFSQLISKNKNDEKKERRRKQNRVAAKKCRERKKNRMIDLLREYKRLEAAHREVNDMLTQVQQDKQKLEQAIAAHAKTCKTFTVDTKVLCCN